MNWGDDLEGQGSGGRPKLLVTVSSNRTVPPDMQQRLSPIVRSEMKQFVKKGITGTIKNPTSLGMLLDPQYQGRFVANTTLNAHKTDGGAVSVLGPEVQTEISVKTDYDIETSPPSPSPDEKGLMYTMKKTLVTTTREVTTCTKQEIRTELEVIHVDSEVELPQRLLKMKNEADKVGVSVTTMSCVDNEKLGSSKNQGLIMGMVKTDLQNANENICKGVENNLFAEK